MAKKGQLENIDLQKGKVKELKRQLNRHGVNFSLPIVIQCGTTYLFKNVPLSNSVPICGYLAS